MTTPPPALERTVLRDAWWPGDIAIADGTIVEVGIVNARPHDRIVDCSGTIVTAGLVNAHHHVAQTMTRGQAVDLDLAAWLRTLYPRWGRMETEDVRSAALFGFIELIRSGCTLTVDHHYVVPRSDDSHFDAIADAARVVGLRLFLARGSIDLGLSHGGLAPDELVEDTDAALASMDAVATRLHDGHQVWVALAPNSAHSTSLQLMRGAAELAQRRGLRLHTHLSENPAVVAEYQERFDRTPVQLLEDLGWLASTTWVAHATHLSDEEVRMLGRAGTGVAHCPSGNARLGTGICRVRDLLHAGSPVGLGVDGGAVNESLALFPELRQALYMARLRAGHPASFSPADALTAATEGGAACLGLDASFGRIEVGRPADLAVWPAEDLLDFPDAITGLVFGPTRCARDVFVAGRRVVQDGNVTTVDETTARIDLQRRSARLRS